MEEFLMKDILKHGRQEQNRSGSAEQIGPFWSYGKWPKWSSNFLRESLWRVEMSSQDLVMLPGGLVKKDKLGQRYPA